ncbi:hypothetical protein LXL04_007775 [Taraxacum kok-saghyz]
MTYQQSTITPPTTTVSQQGIKIAVPCYSGSSGCSLTFNHFSDILGILRGLESSTCNTEDPDSQSKIRDPGIPFRILTHNSKRLAIRLPWPQLEDVKFKLDLNASCHNLPLQSPTRIPQNFTTYLKF